MADLIERKVRYSALGLTAVGSCSLSLGLTPQKPLQRAYQRDPEAIEAWQRERYPAIAQQAKASGGEVFFGMIGFRADSRARPDLGEGPNAGCRTPRPATVGQRGFGGEREGRHFGIAPMRAA